LLLSSDFQGGQIPVLPPL